MTISTGEKVVSLRLSSPAGFLLGSERVEFRGGQLLAGSFGAQHSLVLFKQFGRCLVRVRERWCRLQNLNTRWRPQFRREKLLHLQNSRLWKREANSTKGIAHFLEKHPALLVTIVCPLAFNKLSQ
jgi:hypothetical protein